MAMLMYGDMYHMCKHFKNHSHVYCLWTSCAAKHWAENLSVHKTESCSPGYGIRFFHPWILTLHTGWKVVFWKARYTRITPTQKSCFHPVCRLGIHEWDLGLRTTKTVFLTIVPHNIMMIVLTSEQIPRHVLQGMHDMQLYTIVALYISYCGDWIFFASHIHLFIFISVCICFHYRPLSRKIILLVVSVHLSIWACETYFVHPPWRMTQISELKKKTLFPF